MENPSMKGYGGGKRGFAMNGGTDATDETQKPAF